MEPVQVVEASESQLSTLLSQLEGGTELIYITRAGKVVARLEAYDAANERVGGQWKDKVWMADDFDGLPPDIARDFGVAPG